MNAGKVFTPAVQYFKVLKYHIFICPSFNFVSIAKITTCDILISKVPYFEGLKRFLKGRGYQKGGGANEKEGVEKVLPTMLPLKVKDKLYHEV